MDMAFLQETLTYAKASPVASAVGLYMGCQNHTGGLKKKSTICSSDDEIRAEELS